MTMTLLLGSRYCIAVPRISGGKLSWSYVSVSMKTCSSPDE
jgi:hypothetical protein